jgi:hypothetical protein
LLPRARLRCDQRTVAGTLWALTPDAYLRLVHEAGWPIEKFHAWLADLLQRLFLPWPAAQSASARRYALCRRLDVTWSGSTTRSSTRGRLGTCCQLMSATSSQSQRSFAAVPATLSAGRADPAYRSSRVPSPLNSRAPRRPGHLHQHLAGDRGAPAPRAPSVPSANENRLVVADVLGTIVKITGAACMQHKGAVRSGSRRRPRWTSGRVDGHDLSATITGSRCSSM